MSNEPKDLIGGCTLKNNATSEIVTFLSYLGTIENLQYKIKTRTDEIRILSKSEISNWTRIIPQLPNLVVEKVVHIKYYIGLDNVDFDIEALLETLLSIDDGIAITYEDKQIAILKKYGIINSEGSNRGGYPAQKGPQYASFVALLQKTYDQQEGLM